MKKLLQEIMELPIRKSYYGLQKNIPMVGFVMVFAFLFLTVRYPWARFIILRYTAGPTTTSSSVKVEGGGGGGLEKCDLFTGEWIPNPEAPYYTNRSCWAIHEHQNCIKYGRSDSGFMKWRWKPDGCDLPVLDPFEFLELLRGKSMAFVGDSVARNHMQSLVCLLSRVIYTFHFTYIYFFN